MEFHEYIYDNWGHGSWESYFGDCLFACDFYDGTESPEAFAGRMLPQGFFDYEFFYHFLCYVSERSGSADAGREKFVTAYLGAFDDFYKSFEGEYAYPVDAYLERNSYDINDVDTVVAYADGYCSTLLEVYMENSAQATLPPSVTPEPSAGPEPSASPEPSAVPEPSVIPEPSASPEPDTTDAAVTPAGAETEIPYGTSLLLREVQKTNMLLSGILFTLLFFWLVKKARTIVGGMTNDGKTD